jgi:uncharacterized protein YjiS (DUF1127 family)
LTSGHAQFRAGRTQIEDTTMKTFRPTKLLPGLQDLATWSSHRKARRALDALDDRMLRDMGIDRGQIHDAVHGRDFFSPSRNRH